MCLRLNLAPCTYSQVHNLPSDVTGFLRPYIRWGCYITDNFALVITGASCTWQNVPYILETWTNRVPVSMQARPILPIAVIDNNLRHWSGESMEKRGNWDQDVAQSSYIRRLLRCHFYLALCLVRGNAEVACMGDEYRHFWLFSRWLMADGNKGTKKFHVVWSCISLDVG